ncbi:MAG TPA: ribosome biogenesis GTP-binding protein YihA/YsxC [Prolixibacteraceae bacterium]|nr:ribosome biogenesis GTP-binding protein YihA/YsxC [Prolixibacteraceae bacterium]HPB05350.1 ribosome biogenesis GTP-binding protein YihA/YsxC [Prolixibacteraceae bacterium]HQN94344.1 ribosome biogenesis GTP-binding protein YihA/YsxC [Prolixibacteraceae bacterium]HUM89454.1 ribosome biogenesis GTP-binding protein YihA/YsxC [Prolixibacteraceae bacterium]
MIIKSAEFIISSTEVEKCPKNNFPEYAFIGRSNVGKSSLINMLTGFNSLAKVSGRPGKTRLINHFLINKEWYLVDLPGYGFAQVAKSEREKWEKFIRKYLAQRENLFCVFVLVDSRHEPQKNDLSFMEWLGENSIPFVIVFTKTDKLGKQAMKEFQDNYAQKMLESWDELPDMFASSADTGAGRDEILDFIERVNKS